MDENKITEQPEKETQYYSGGGSLDFSNLYGNLPYQLWNRVGRIIELKIFDDATALATGDGKLIFCIPQALNGAVIQHVAAYITTVSTSGTPTIQIRNVTDSVDILSTRITIDENEKTSYTATTQPVIDRTKHTLDKGDIIAIDVDVEGTGAKGLGVILELQ